MPHADAPPVRRITARPPSTRRWLAEVAAHGDVLVALSRKDFQTKYKRASLGVAWAVALPLVQAGVLAFVFSRVARFQLEGTGVGMGAYVLSGIVPYSYFSGSLLPATTAIVEGSSLAEKVWFPRVVLVIVPCLSNLVGLVVTLVIALALVPVVDGQLSAGTLLVVPGTVLLVAFLAGAGMVLSAAQVYFRDVKFLLSAALLLWLYVTPVIYPRSALGSLSWVVDLNPLTGPVTLFHAAFGVQGDPVAVPVLVSVGVSAVLLALGVQLHRRLDRLFVDLL